MKTKLKHSLIIISAISTAGICGSGTVWAGTTDLVDVQIVGGTTYSSTAQGYTNTVTAAAGAPIYYAVEVQMGAIGNSDNSKTITTLPYGSAGVDSLSYNLTDSNVTFVAGTNIVQTPFSDATGVSSDGTIGATPAVSNSKESVMAGTGIADVVGSINTSPPVSDKPQGVSAAGGAPALALVQLGTVDNGSSNSVIQGSFGTTSGVFKINNGSTLNGNSITVTSGDPNAYYEFDPLTLNVAASNHIISLTAASAGSPSSEYGNSSLGTLNVTGSAGSYTPAYSPSLNNVNGYVEEKGIAASDPEFYALELTGVDGNGEPTSATVVSDINASNVGVTASLINSQSIFSNLNGTYQILLQATSLSSDQFLGFDFGNTTGLGGVEVEDIAAVPEPTSLGLLALGGIALMRRRRTSVARLGRSNLRSV